MRKKEEYRVIFNTYELNNETNKKHKLRKYIRENLKREFPEKEWSELSTLEKDRFVYITIRENMTKDMDESKRNRIIRKIDGMLNKTLFHADTELEKHNAKVSKAFEIYYNDFDTDDEKKKAYEWFCRDLKAYNEAIPIPNFDEWVEENKLALKKSNPSHSKRIFDYYMDFENEQYKKFHSEYRPATQSQIDSVILKIILKKLNTIHNVILKTILYNTKIDVDKDKLNALNINLDEDKIYECISFLNNYEPEPFDEHLREHNSELDLTEDEQNAIIENGRKYMVYKKMFEDLNFLK